MCPPARSGIEAQSLLRDGHLRIHVHPEAGAPKVCRTDIEWCWRDSLAAPSNLSAQRCTPVSASSNCAVMRRRLQSGSRQPLWSPTPSAHSRWGRSGSASLYAALTPLVQRHPPRPSKEQLRTAPPGDRQFTAETESLPEQGNQTVGPPCRSITSTTVIFVRTAHGTSGAAAVKDATANAAASAKPARARL